MADLGIIDSEIGFAEWENRQWEELSEAEKDHTAYRMAVYAAQVHLSLIHISCPTSHRFPIVVRRVSVPLHIAGK